MKGRQPEGAWYGRDGGARYATRGAEVFHDGSTGWFARCGKRVRGPLSCMDSAMEAADRMLAETAQVQALHSPGRECA